MPPKVNISSQAGSIIKVLKICNLLIFIFSLMKNEAGFPGGSVVKHLPAKARGMGSITMSGSSPGEGNGNSL